MLLQPPDDGLLGLLHGHPVQKAGIDHDAGGAVGKGFLFHIAALYHLDDGQAELFGELPVTGIVAGHRHDGAGAVAHQDVIGDENGGLLAVDGVDGHNAFQPHAGLFLGHFGALEVGLTGGSLPVRPHGIHIGDAVGPLIDIRVFRRHDHVGRAEQGIGAGGIDDQLIAAGGIKFDLGAGGTADPVDLGGLDALQVVHVGKVIDQALGVGGDLEHPLALYLVDDLAAAALADAVYHFLIGQHALAAGAPVDGHFLLIGQPVLK